LTRCAAIADNPFRAGASRPAVFPSYPQIRFVTRKLLAPPVAALAMNSQPGQKGKTAGKKPGGLLSWRPVRRLLLWTHNKTFNLLYRS